MKEIQTTHMKSGSVSSDEYYTPISLIESLGHFDYDPCTPKNPKWRTADIMLTKEDDGLAHDWHGRVWLNPPYSAPLISQFMQKMAKHGSGIALVVPKFGSKMFREWVFPYAKGIFILDKRIKFYDINWIQQKSPICQSVLIAYSEDDISAIIKSGNEGTMLYLNRDIAISKNE